jgi:hypothetical protein
MGCIYHNPRFTYVTGSGEGMTDVQVFQRADCRLVAVVTDPPISDPINGVNAALEQIATKLLKLGFDFDYLVEQHIVRRPGAPEFDLVPLEWNGSRASYHVHQMPNGWRWKHVDRATAEAIVGEPLTVN